MAGKRRIKETKSDDLFILFREYLKRTIEKDLRVIYDEEAYIAEPSGSWVFKMQTDPAS